MDHQACVGCVGCAFGSDSTRKQLPLESQSSGFQARSTQSARPVSTRPAAHLIGMTYLPAILLFCLSHDLEKDVMAISGMRPDLGRPAACLDSLAPLRTGQDGGIFKLVNDRSEERRVGKECRSRWSPYH